MRERKRLWMKKQRSTPEGRKIQNDRARKSWQNGRKDRNKLYLQVMQRVRFFAWRVRLFNTHYKTRYTAKDFAKLWKTQRGLCALSGLKLTAKNCHIDHRIPIARGGSHTLDNLRWTTVRANQMKRDMLDEEFFEMCKSVARWIAKRLIAAHHRLLNSTP